MKIAEARKYEMITTTHQNEKQNLLKQQKAELDSVYLEIIDKNKEEFNKELTELQVPNLIFLPERSIQFMSHSPKLCSISH